MKLAITGKGDTGKTTIAGMLAHYFNNDGYQVLAASADPPCVCNQTSISVSSGGDSIFRTPSDTASTRRLSK